MNKLLKCVAALLALIVVLFAGLALFIGTLNADKYRPQIIAEIAKHTGRTAKLNGPISFSLGLGGVKISIQDASISNPSWASRPVMAGMGRFQLSVGLLPLLSHEISVNQLTIENADILLETNADGQHNWDFGTAVKPASALAMPAKTSSAPREAVSIAKLSIVSSQIALRSADGKISSTNVAALDLDMTGTGMSLAFKGDANGAPITLALKTSITDLLSQQPFTFDADATYQALHLIAKGKTDLGSSKAEISGYDLMSGKTKISGALNANWGGPHPVLRGTLNSDHLDPADFKSDAASDTGASPTTNETPGGKKRIFSDAPLPFDALKSVDADLSVSIGEFPMGKDALKQLSAKLTLSGGMLTLAPVKANVGASTIDFQLRLNAAQNPAQVMIGVIANGVDLGDLQKLGGMSPFMTGKAGANIQLSGQGNSAHDIAASLGGLITVTAEKGEILTGAAAGISSALAAVFTGGGGDDAINCLAARFVAKNGVLTDNGILIDSAASVVSGKGNVNLGSENVDMALHAKTKLVDVGGLVPAVEISGPLSKPAYAVDAVGLVKSAVGTLLNGNVDVLSSTVPDIQTAPAGQNACVYTLDHPKGAAATGILPSGFAGKASQQLQNLGSSLVKGLFGQ